jgi:hypothetical protein
MTNKDIRDLKRKHPSFKYQEAREEGYSDDQICDFLKTIDSKENKDSESFEKKHVFFEIQPKYNETVIKTSWIEKTMESVQDFSIEYPIPFYLSAFFIILFSTCTLIFFMWKLMKVCLYQIVFTIVKASKDAKEK